MTTTAVPSEGLFAEPVNARRVEALLLGALVTLSGAGWVLTHALATSDSRLGLLTGAGIDGGGHLQHHHRTGGGDGFELVGVGLFLAMWVVMVAAMMLPTALPVVATFDRWRARTKGPAALTYAFLSGYLSIWSACGLVAYSTLLLLRAAAPDGDDGVVRIGAVLLAGAGAFQFSQLKRSCLRHCRSPLSVVAGTPRRCNGGTEVRGGWASDTVSTASAAVGP